MNKDMLGDAILTGNFTLRSGRTSNFYVDKYKFLSNPDTFRAIGYEIAYHHITMNTTKIAGAELGGALIAAAQSITSRIPAVFIRNERKSYGSQNKIEGVLEPNDVVLLLEDITTTGQQVIEAANEIIAVGATVDKIVSVVDRGEGARENIEAAGFKFECLVQL